jgi:moderate conductance mechanosensitive channel
MTAAVPLAILLPRGRVRHYSGSADDGTTLMVWLRALVLWVVLALPAAAQTAAPATAEPAPPPAVEELLRLLGQPEVQGWLAERTPDAEALATTPPAAAESAVELELEAAERQVTAAVARWHAHRDRVIAALPRLPGELSRGLQRLYDEGGRGVVLLLVAVFVAAGFAAEWLFVRTTRTIRRRVLTADETTVRERLQKAALRLGLVLGAVLVFAAASLGIFLLVDLPPLVREVAGRLLFAFIVFRLIRYIARLILAPTTPRLRIMPVDDASARFWLARITAFVAIFAFGWAVATSLVALGVAPPQPTIVAYIIGLGLVAVAIETIWRRPLQPIRATPPAPVPAASETIPGFAGTLAGSADTGTAGDATATPAAEPTPAAAATATVAGSRTVSKIALSAFAVLVFVLWLIDARALMWLALVGAFLLMALNVVCYSVNNLLRPIGQAMDQEEGPPSVAAAAIERGARALLITGAVLFLLWAWGLDLRDLTGEGDARNPLVIALINIAIIVIVFDFLWHVGHTAIDRYISDADSGTPVSADEARRRARLRTLLPIGRHVLQVVLGVTAVLMILASMGVQIAPLIAGAGVVGVAIGFGSQTLVRDIMSGMFYLLDDAFRVGEYIVADKYKGTVEGFSLRSIKLRHHRGPLFTIPFGSLGAIQNMSREWVIVKLAFTVPFDTDINKVKKVIKGVDAQLQADPELAPGFLEPLKSQGADEIVPHGIVIRCKFKAIPGTQFMIRRRANALIKQAFAENGIDFAFPTVRVAGSGDEAAAAKTLLDAEAASKAAE